MVEFPPWLAEKNAGSNVTNQLVSKYEISKSDARDLSGGRGALDVNLQRAAKQRSELSPRRGFRALGSGWLDWQSREAAAENNC